MGKPAPPTGKQGRIFAQVNTQQLSCLVIGNPGYRYENVQCKVETKTMAKAER